MKYLKISSLPNSKTWIDRDTVMLHACFQILKDCVEKEKVCEKCDPITHKNEIEEIMFLYTWWEKRKTDKSVNNDKDDDIMLTRLINIRKFLWT